MPPSNSDNNGPLANRTIIITRARAQAAIFARELEKYGARVVSCPTIEIVEPDSFELLDEAIESLYGYDWLIFTSVNGVTHFLRRLIALGHEPTELDELRVCAIGESTAASLREAAVHVDVVPEQFQAEGVMTALKEYLDNDDAFKSLNFLMPRAAVARDYLPLALESVGARVDVIPAYRTVKPNRSELGRVAALLEGGAIDCVAFTSSSSVANFAKLFDTSDLSHLLRGVAVACIGDITASTASEYGLHPDIQPKMHSISTLAHAIADYFKELPT
jgi:uroporphyrinogen III methyltransferase / synthase